MSLDGLVSDGLVKIFGERNVGTNALARLIETNSHSRLLPSTEYDVDPDASRHAWARQPRERERLLDRIYAGVPDPSSWKHAATNFADAGAFERTLVLFCIKHPAPWLTSLFRHPYHVLGEMPDNITDFLGFAWETPQRERLGGASFRPLELYDAKIRSYLAFAERLDAAGIAFSFVRSEDLLLDQKNVFRSLAPRLAGARARFHMRRRSSKNGWLPLFLVQRYYRQERWRDALRGVEDVVNRAVDWAALERFGYRPL
jgi:hypothetical protein